MTIRMELSRLLIHENSSQHIIELKEVDGERVFPIVIGMFEAQAINRRLMGQQVSRPQTHDLLARVIEQMGGKIDHVLVNDLLKEPDGGTFMARLVIHHDGKTLDLDSRPSDAIALGIATNVPIYVEDHVLEQVWGT